MSGTDDLERDRQAQISEILDQDRRKTLREISADAFLWHMPADCYR